MQYCKDVFSKIAKKLARNMNKIIILYYSILISTLIVFIFLNMNETFFYNLNNKYIRIIFINIISKRVLPWFIYGYTFLGINIIVNLKFKKSLFLEKGIHFMVIGFIFIFIEILFKDYSFFVLFRNHIRGLILVSIIISSINFFNEFVLLNLGVKKIELMKSYITLDLLIISIIIIGWILYLFVFWDLGIIFFYITLIIAFLANLTVLILNVKKSTN